MSGKFKLICLVVLGCWLAAASGQNNKHLKSPRFLVIGEQIMGSYKALP